MSLPDRLQLCFVGAVVPDEPEFRTGAFNRSGNLFQSGLLEGMAEAGVRPRMVLSFVPVPSFPRSRKVWQRSALVKGPGGVPIRLLGFPNVVVVKQAWIGISAFFRLIRLGLAAKRRSAEMVMLVFNMRVPPAALMLLGARLVGARTIGAVIDLDEPGETVPDTWLHRLDFRMQKAAIRRFDGLVVVSEEIARDFARPEQPTIRIEGAVSIGVLDLTGRGMTRPRGEERFVLVAAGALTEANGIGVILEAFRKLPREGYRLLIAGAGRLEGLVREAAANDARIRYAGLLDHAGVLELYNEADVLLNVRLTKAIRTPYVFPSKLLEYLATGVPVISTDVGRMRERFGNVVMFLADETPESLTAAIGELRERPASARWESASKAREIVRQEFTWSVQGRRVADFVRRVADWR
jgi:glycosyltransferase involved in cell wall biosynthesis